MFLYLPFHPELSSTNVTYITLFMCLFMCKRHFKHCYVKCLGNNSRMVKDGKEDGCDNNHVDFGKIKVSVSSLI